MLPHREGRLEDRPKRIKGELLPFDGQDVNALLNELATQKDAQGVPFIVRYRNEDGAFIQISKFSTHQSPHYSEKASAIKPPKLPESGRDDGGGSPGGDGPSSGTDSRKTHRIKRGSQPPDSLNPDSLNPDSPIPDSPIPESEPSPQEGRGEARATRLPAHWRPGSALVEWSYTQHPDWDLAGSAYEK